MMPYANMKVGFSILGNHAETGHPRCVRQFLRQSSILVTLYKPTNAGVSNYFAIMLAIISQ